MSCSYRSLAKLIVSMRYDKAVKIQCFYDAFNFCFFSSPFHLSPISNNLDLVRALLLSHDLTQEMHSCSAHCVGILSHMMGQLCLADMGSPAAKKGHYWF